MEINNQWSSEAPNILASAPLELIRQALSEGWVAGLHFYYGGGGSGDAVAFSNYKALHTHISNARAGDLFILWSIARHRKNNDLLADLQFNENLDSQKEVIAAQILDPARKYLAQNALNEILLIASLHGNQLNAICTDLDGTYQDNFLDTIEGSALQKGGVCILPMTRLDSTEYYLFKGKRPNENGEVPLGGSY